MKKKIKDLTVAQLLEYCENQEPCDACPFSHGYLCKLNTPYDLEEETLEQEVEIPNEPVKISDQLEE